MYWFSYPYLTGSAHGSLLIQAAIKQDFAEKYAENIQASSSRTPEHLTLLLRAAARLLADDASESILAPEMPQPHPA